jgi:hypothetical protein
MTHAAKINFCGVVLAPDDYDDHVALRAYVAKHCRHFMTPLERRTTEYTVPITSETPPTEKARRIYAMLENRDGHVEDRETLNAFAVPSAERERNAIDRLIRDCYALLPINRCPACERLVRTPLARQCLWCGHRWSDCG